MAENPYQPLPSESTPPSPPSAGGVPIDVGGNISRAWAVYIADPVTLTMGVFGGILFNALPVIVALVVAYFAGYGPDTREWQQAGAVAGLIGLFWSPLILAGLARFVLTAARGGEAQLYEIFSESGRYPQFLVWTLILSGPTTVLSAAAQLLLGTGFLSAGAALSFVQMGYGLMLWIACALGPITAQYYIVDRELGALDALKAAWNEAAPMRGHTLVVTLAMTLISAAGALVCGVGACASVPIGMLMLAILYLQVRARQPSS